MTSMFLFAMSYEFVFAKHWNVEGIFARMLHFTFPLQLEGTCLPQKKCFALDLVYYMVGIA